MMGLLAGLEDGSGFDLRDCEHFVGTSAGSIVAAHLVAGDAPRRPPSVSTEIELPAGPARVGRLAVAAVAARAARRGMAMAAGSRSRRSRSGSRPRAARCCGPRCCAGFRSRTRRSRTFAGTSSARARGSTAGSG